MDTRPLANVPALDMTQTVVYTVGMEARNGAYLMYRCVPWILLFLCDRDGQVLPWADGGEVQSGMERDGLLGSAESAKRQGKDGYGCEWRLRW